MPDLTDIANRMHQRLAETGRPQEFQIDGEMKLRLEPAPGGALLLATIGQYRHWPREDRPRLLEAFGVPAGTPQHSTITAGWQVMKWTWTPGAPPPETTTLTRPRPETTEDPGDPPPAQLKLF